MSGPQTETIEVTPRERKRIVQALRAMADQKEEEDQPAIADQFRGLASRIDR